MSSRSKGTALPGLRARADRLKVGDLDQRRSRFVQIQKFFRGWFFRFNFWRWLKIFGIQFLVLRTWGTLERTGIDEALVLPPQPPQVHIPSRHYLLIEWCKVTEWEYLLNKKMRHNHFTVKQMHFIEHTPKITLTRGMRCCSLKMV